MADSRTDETVPRAGLTGRLLEGRYRVGPVLGEGGMGTVYRARDERMGRDVVVKVPHARFLAERGFRERFAQEIRSLTELEHPHIVRVLDAGTLDDTPFAVLQYLAGGSLRDLLAKCGGQMDSAAVLAWLPGIATAIDFIHRQGLVHRDLKPGNILFDGEGNVHLADFGLAKALAASDAGRDGEGLTEAGQVLGSPDYMAPEQCMGGELSGAVDQYALAAVVYEALAGQLPFRGSTPLAVLVKKQKESPISLATLAPGLPGSAGEAVMRALDPSAAGRFESSSAFARAFRAGLAAPAPTDPPRPPSLAPRARVATLVDVAGLHVAPEQVEAARRLGVPAGFENSLGMRFVLIPPGEFSMGSVPSEEGRDPDEAQHTVRLTRGCYLQVTEVTNAQYRRFRPEHDTGAFLEHSLSGDAQPAVEVSHDHASAFAAWLREHEPGRGYRLPTEAEWEHAARAGTTTPFWFGETLTTDLSNYDGNATYGNGPKGEYRRRATEVGSLAPNGWGLYDMHGNVWEWCSDWFGGYPSGLIVDPVGPPKGTRRVMRGGSWINGPRNARSAFRGRGLPSAATAQIGFRLACDLPSIPS